MDNDTLMTMGNESWTEELDNDTLTFTLNLNHSSDVTNTSVSQPSDPKLNEQELLLAYARIAYGNYYEYNFPITFVVCLVGLVTNSLNIIVFTRKNMINSVNFFLAALSVADILLISSQLTVPIHYFFAFRGRFHYDWVRADIFIFFLECFGLSMCNWLVVTVGIWRLLAINWPLRAREWCSMSRAKKVLAILVASGLCVSMPVFALLGVKEYSLFGKIFYISYFVEGIFLKIFFGGLLLINFVPCMVLVVINGLLCRSLLSCRSQRPNNFAAQNHDIQRKRNYKTTMMLTVLLVLFVISNLPNSVHLLLDFFTEDTGFTNVAQIFEIFNMLNNSVSFFIYYFMGENFRKSFKAIFNFNNFACLRFFGIQDNARMKDSVATVSSDLASVSPRNSLTNETTMDNIDGFAEGEP